MKRVLLISNDVLHYREKIYNYFFERFLEDGYEFEVLGNKFQKVDYELKYNHYELQFSVKEYIGKIKEEKPAIVIVFLHLKDKVLFPVIHYCKRSKIPVIFWNIGINALTPNARIKNMVFNHIHNMCDALITYTPDTKAYFSKKNQHKLFVAYNTLYLTESNASISKQELRKKYNVKSEKVILFISRLLPYKRLDILINQFKGDKKIGVVIVGPGLEENQKEIIDQYDNLYYLGEKYGKEVDEIYQMGDIFSTPGHIGLAIVQAFYWGLPVLLMKGHHAPEIYYMKDGKTGFFAENENELSVLAKRLLFDDSLLRKMSDECKQTYEREANIRNMYKGFIDAVHYAEHR